MIKKREIKRIALACQGGGSHTAFTAGVLKRILKEQIDIVALSGTSGGAICALAVWCGLLMNDRNRSAELLDSFWRDNSAKTYWEVVLNTSLLWATRLRSSMTIPEVSPYLYPSWGQEYLKSILEQHFDFDKIRSLIKPSSPDLLISAVDVSSGEFKIFRNEEISLNALLASSAVPVLFRAVNIDGRIYWDGMFSRNPPVHDLPKSNPEEIWVIQINQQSLKSEPKSIIDIHDRRNELAGNISMNQEIYFIEKVNHWLEAGVIQDTRYKHIKVRRIEMKQELDFASKLDRSPSFISEMMDYGREQAEGFLREVSR